MDARDQLGDSVDDLNREIDRFPDGMRVLAVDDDVIYLKILEASLRKCKYEVTTANDAKQALEILRENRFKFDMVISDVQMPDMDGFQFLQQLGQEIDLPVIMVSGNGDNEFIKKGISYGACCYLVKPVSNEVFKTIWQHAFRRKKLNTKVEINSSGHKVFSGTKESEGKGISTSSSSDSNGKQSKQKLKRKHQNRDDEECEDDDDDDDDDDGDENEGPSTLKKRRIVWTEELKKKFNDVYYYLGPEKAVPKKILELMNVEGLSRGNVASHLQKFREQLRKGKIDQHKHRTSVVSNLGRKDFCYMRHTNVTDESGGRFLSAAPLSSCMPPQMVSRSSTSTAAAAAAAIDIRQSILNNNGSTTTYPYQRLPDSSSRNQYPLRVHSLNPELFDNVLCRSSNFLNDNRYCESWQRGMQDCGQLYQLPSTTLLRSEDSDFGLLPTDNLSVYPSTSYIGNTPHDDFSSIGALSASVEELGDIVHTKNKEHIVPIIHSTPNIWWEDDKQSNIHSWDLSSIVSSNDVVDPPTQRNMNSSMFDQYCNWEKTNITHGVEVDNSIMQNTIDPNDGLVQYGVESLDDQVYRSDMINQVELENELDLDFLDKEIGFHNIQEQKKKD